MNWDTIQGNWKQLTGRAKQQWGKLTDDDLTEIVRLGGPVRQVAIAKRPKLSEKVTTALVDLGSEAAVETACANDNAAFSERSLQKAQEALGQRPSLLLHGGGAAALASRLGEGERAPALVLEGLAVWARLGAEA